jgi:inosine-uridine nucleoside N-ribohydrolase
MGRMKKERFLAAFAALMLVAVGSARSNSQAVPAADKSGQRPQLAILDTDIGDDIDDAFALALILRSPELRLLGVTTAFGDTELRAQLLDRYLKAVDRTDIQVAAGPATEARNVFTQAAYAKQPALLRDDACLMHLLSVSQAPVPKSVQDRYDACEKDRHDAVGFLLNQIRAHPGEITLIAIGPLFNLQAAIERDPATFKKLKRVVIMGGSVYRGYDSGSNTHTPPSPEWNIRCDPAGARALLGSGVPVFVMPLDSTQIRLELPALGAVFAHGLPLTDQLTLLYHQWNGAGEWRPPTLYDPVAVTYAIRPDLCPAVPMRLEVDDQGFSRLAEGVPNAQVCLHSDEKGFLEFLISRIVEETAP